MCKPLKNKRWLVTDCNNDTSMLMSQSSTTEIKITAQSFVSLTLDRHVKNVTLSDTWGPLGPQLYSGLTRERFINTSYA